MIKKLLPMLLAVGLAGCSTSPLIVQSPIVYESVDTVAPEVKSSYGIQYLRSNQPLSDSFIALPFLFDGDVVLRTEFDVAKWKNKRFKSIEGRDFTLTDRYIVNMKNGDIRPLFEGREFEFKYLQESLKLKVMPLSYDVSVPDYLVISEFTDKQSNIAVLVIEDPYTQRVHGFIESPSVPLW
jgi:hypothetical protein